MEQEAIVRAHMGQCAFMERNTAAFLLYCLMPLYFFQNSKWALQRNSPGHLQMECQIGSSYSQGNNRDDFGTGIGGSPLPICETSIANQELLKELHVVIIQYLVEVLGMNPDDEKLVKYHSFLWFLFSGMGYHGDFASEVHTNYFFARMSFSFGGKRSVSLKTYQFKNDETKATRRYHGPEIESISTRSPADMYVMSSYASGAHPLCFIDEDKSVGVQVMHQVDTIQDKEAMNVILDIPFRTVHDMMRAIYIIKSTPFVLPTKEGMAAYGELLEIVARLELL